MPSMNGQSIVANGSRNCSKYRRKFSSPAPQRPPMPSSLSRSHTSIGSICIGVAVRSSRPLVRSLNPGLALVP